MGFYFVPSLRTFISEEYKTDGTYSDESWPKDAVLCTEAESLEYRGAIPPAGKMLSATDHGRPCWEDIPEPSIDELISNAESKKASLQREVEDLIKPLDRAKNLGIATELELSMLSDLEVYSVYLMRVDTSHPDKIEWPQKPY